MPVILIFLHGIAFVQGTAVMREVSKFLRDITRQYFSISIWKNVYATTTLSASQMQFKIFVNSLFWFESNFFADEYMFDFSFRRNMCCFRFHNIVSFVRWSASRA